MPLQVYSGRIPHHGQRGYTGPDGFNVTRGSGGTAGSPFAPSAALLGKSLKLKRAAKGDQIKLQQAWELYVPEYVAEMRASYKQHRRAWLELLARPRVVLLCYCGTASRCHRAILRTEILPKLGAVDCGELQVPSARPTTPPVLVTPGTAALLDLAQEMTAPGTTED